MFSASSLRSAADRSSRAAAGTSSILLIHGGRAGGGGFKRKAQGHRKHVLRLKQAFLRVEDLRLARADRIITEGRTVSRTWGLHLGNTGGGERDRRPMPPRRYRCQGVVTIPLRLWRYTYLSKEDAAGVLDGLADRSQSRLKTEAPGRDEPPWKLARVQ